MENQPIEDQISEIMNALDFYDRKYEREAVDKAVALREEIAPVLIDHLKMLLDDYGQYEADDHYAHIYAFMLLGHFRETRAHDVITDIISLPEHVVESFFGDMITQDFHWIMYATCGGCIDRIKQLVLNRNAYEYCRGAGMQAIVHAVADGVLNRAAALEFFSSLFESDHAEPGSHFWNEAASSICDLYPSELMPIIEKAYESGLIWPGYISHKEFLRTLAAGKEKTLEETKSKLNEDLSRDIHSRLSWWACFREPMSEEGADIISQAAIGRNAGQAKSKKIGRNELCPCGSKMKFKKCCGLLQ